MKALFLTSSLETNYKDEFGNRIPKAMENKNKILDNFKKYINKYDNFLFICSDETNHEITDMHANLTFESLNMSIPFKNYTVLDGRNKKQAKKLIENADFIFLCGGHVPTQNKFFEKINLKELLKDCNVPICGASAGSMNCADIVYAQPELEGEVLDKNYKRYINGLGLTKINIFPHIHDIIGEQVDGVTQFELAMEDSYTRPIIAYSDGTYILQVDKTTLLYGKAYIFNKGQVNEINTDEKSLDITNLVTTLYN